MKKQMLGVAVASCMLLSMIPAATAEAAPFLVHSYEEWLEEEPKSAGNQFGYDFGIAGYGYGNGDKFQWPEENVEIDIRNSLSIYGDWNIPSNVTVNNYSTVSLEGKLTIQGTWNNIALDGNAKVRDNWNDPESGVIVENGGKFICSEKSLGTSPFENMTVKSGGTLQLNDYGLWIKEGKTLELESGANLVGGKNITVKGTLKADDFQTSIQMDTAGEARLEGNLTLPILSVRNGSCTIPAGTSLTCGTIVLGPDEFDENKEAYMKIAGEITCDPTVTEWGGTISLGNGIGTVTVELADSGVINLKQGADLAHMSETAKVIGNGRINAYVNLPADGITAYPRLNSVPMFYENAIAGVVEPGYLADTITIWKNWDCSHEWIKGEVVAPTCTSEGYTDYTCQICGEKKQDDVTAKVPHQPEENKNCEQDKKCTVCGEVVIPAGQHEFGEGKVVLELTCTEEGKKEFTCTACGSKKEEAIPAAGHQWKSEEKDGTVKMVCESCSEEITVTFGQEEGIGVSFDESVLNNFAKEYGAFDDILVEAEAAEDLSVAQEDAIKNLGENVCVVELTAKAVVYDESGAIVNEEIISKLGGKATVTLSYDFPEDMDGKIAKVCYIAPDGQVEAVEAVFDFEEDTVTFATEHFSTYAVYVTEKPEEPEEPELPTDPENQGTQDPTEDPKPQDPAEQPDNKPDSKPDQNNTVDKDQTEDTQKGSGVPYTGEETNSMTWILLMLAGVGTAGAVAMKRKRAV